MSGATAGRAEARTQLDRKESAQPGGGRRGGPAALSFRELSNA